MCGRARVPVYRTECFRVRIHTDAFVCAALASTLTFSIKIYIHQKMELPSRGAKNLSDIIKGTHL